MEYRLASFAAVKL